MKKSEVIAALGDPDRRQTSTVSGLNMDLYYYEGLDGTLQVVFDNGEVVAINDY